MEDFIFYNPTKIVFGRDTIKEIGEYSKEYGKKALLVYGKGSIKRNGVYNKIIDSLKKNKIKFVELPGVKSNPVDSYVREGINLARKSKVDHLIAAGGGSVIDEAKAIAAGINYKGDFWDFYEK